MRTKVVFLTLAALLGILAVMENLFLILGLLGCSFIFLLKQKRVEGKYILLSFLIFSIFFIRAGIVVQENQTHLSGKEERFILSFNEIENIDGDVLTVAANDQTRSERLMIRYKIQSEREKQLLKSNLSPGLVCQVEGILEKPSESSNPNSFNYREYLLQNRIHWILKPKTLQINACQEAPTLMTSIKMIRYKGFHYLETHFPEKAVPLAAALLFGSDDFISPETMDHYRELGIVHLLAISGLHIAIVVAIFYQLLLRIGITRENTVILLLALLPVYGVLTGASPSVNRSVIMTMILLIAKRWGPSYQISPLDGLCVTFLVYSFASPYVIYNVGFQLSFLVTFALLVSLPYLLGENQTTTTALFVTSFISMISSAPILLHFFYEFSIISLVVNLLYIPLFNVVILPLVLACFLLHLLFKGWVDPFIFVLTEIIDWTNKVTEFISRFPFNQLLVGKPNHFSLFLYVVGFFSYFVVWEKFRKQFYYKMGLLLIPICLVLSQMLITTYSSEGEITFLDVGQGDSIFIRLPYGKGTYLIDTGGAMLFNQEQWQQRQRPYEVGRDTVVPFLKSKGAAVIDKVIITHGDFDHAGGAQAVLNELKVKELVLPLTLKKNELETKLVQQAHQKGIPVRFVQQGDQWNSGNYVFTVLSPIKHETTENINNTSIVLYSEMGGLRWLLTGDLEEDGEKKLMEQYKDINTDVLKIGHHGSKTSTTELLLNKVSPKIAIISVGKDNRFNHPNGEVLKRLKSRNIKIVRTDISGAITYRFKKETGTFWVHRP
ncbi:DNA internalization-related competence protein ComEC/Rec2 [Niallia sp. XMNu-256]|uniref:DNA internalization-related competence protein ComEC/Rec2 n=1 Tax=Niallia sp. XMNu-256 TaxID=3082444 RepID=UPI0030CFF1E4